MYMSVLIYIQACHYCGKATVADAHYNGLDRIDSTKRVPSLSTT